MTETKQKIIKIHFYLLGFIFLNFIIRLLIGLSLNSQLIFALKVILYLSGIVLFFLNVKPFRKARIYFSLYVISPFLIFFGWLADGIFGAILASIFLFFFQPPTDAEFKNDEITIYSQSQGLMGRCCSYDIIKQYFFIFERKVTEFNFEEADFSNAKLKTEKDTLYINFRYNDYDYNTKEDIAKDSIIKLNIK